MLRDVLIRARDGGTFAKLPLGERCTLVVEEHDGLYGWSDLEPDGSESYLARLDGEVSSKPVGGQIDHWIEVLDRIASGKERDSDWSFLAPGHAIERLAELGDRSVVPLLKFVRRWAGTEEWDGDRPRRGLAERPSHTPTIQALMMVRGSGCRTREVELLLRDIVRRSAQANSTRRLWGIMPVWAARCLFDLFEGYPAPKQSAWTNELVNRAEFTRRRGRPSPGRRG